MKKILVLLAVVAMGCFAASCSKKENKSSSNVPSVNTQSYSIQIAPAQEGALIPAGISFGAYGTLKVTVIDNLTSTEVENPSVRWSTDWSGATFDAQTSTVTVFRAPSSGSSSISRTITVSYKGFSKDLIFMAGNVSVASSNRGTWYAGDNDNNIIDGNIKISHSLGTGDLQIGVPITYTVDVYHNGVIDNSEDCSQAVWTFTGAGFDAISGTTG
ncbi:MAG: hypothetical protein LBL00_06735, partial [Endomicrobium sp.]|nr:hypothetical protein [Endomicrobium sp.]